jgi:GxxExxY protein
MIKKEKMMKENLQAQSATTDPLPLAGITEKIIGCAYTVYNKMGFGFLESVYEKCMVIELHKAGILVAAQQPIKVSYAGELVGDFVADLLVENKVIIELKSVFRISPAHDAQLSNYLAATGMPVGLLINFGESHVEVRRKTPRLAHTTHVASASNQSAGGIC